MDIEKIIVFFIYCGFSAIESFKWISLDDSKSLRSTLPKAGECGKIPLSSRIFGGSETLIDEFPWTAMLVYENRDLVKSTYCGGSLINTFFVLTAASCVDDNLNREMGWLFKEVRLGEWDISTPDDCEPNGKRAAFCAPPPITRTLANKFVHPEFDIKKQSNNIALLQLMDRVEYTDFISPICLPLEKGQDLLGYADATAEVTGWGKTQKAASSPVKLKANVEIRKLVECVDQMIRAGVENSITYSSNQQACAMGADTNACKGDTGGPLMIRDTQNGKEAYYLIGIVSFGFDTKTCKTKGNPSIFTRVAPYLHWIKETISST
ncbi:serine protease easter [Zeugodacus cucurbitae]|uniref:Serine protease easter n=1 Tax=Zeugodacus cucurbitae TaxID=28588 RepID=A0A0A1WQQ0_ZEUCU|nr:serine protease easter [Zeugodacus cucurbitae]